MDSFRQQRLYIYLATAFRTVIPKPGDRIPLTKETWPHLLSPILPILVMAYLVRRPHTHLLRILIFPIALFTSLRAGFCYVWLDPDYNVYNFGGGLFALVVIARALEYTFAANGVKKVDETVPGQSSVPAIATGSKPSSPVVTDALAKRPLGGIIPDPVSDALEVLCSMRGIGFEYGHGVTIPPETRPLEKGPFLRATFHRFLISFLLLDFFESFAKLAPPLQTSRGGSIFIPSLPWPQRYALSTTVHLASGLAILSGFEMIYSLLTIFCVGVLSHSPTAWPPVSDSPWRSQSLHEFWAKRWHQVLRRTFMIYGGLPGKWLGEHLGVGGDIGVLFGTFLASGLFHELASYAMGRGLDWHAPAFFLLNGFLVMSERVWRRVTGRRVGGLAGRAFSYFTIVILGQTMIDSWHRRGLGGGLVIPPVISPMRQIVFPSIAHLYERLPSRLRVWVYATLSTA